MVRPLNQCGITAAFAACWAVKSWLDVPSPEFGTNSSTSQVMPGPAMQSSKTP